MEALITRIESLIAYLRCGLGVLTGLLAFAVFFCVSANVFGRFVLNSSYTWAEGMARFFFIWTVLVGGGLGCLANENIAVSFIKDKVPAAAAHVFEFLKIVVVYAVCVAIFVAYHELASGYVRLTPLLGISMIYFYMAMLVFAVMLALANTMDLLRAVVRLKGMS